MALSLPASQVSARIMYAGDTDEIVAEYRAQPGDLVTLIAGSFTLEDSTGTIVPGYDHIPLTGLQGVPLSVALAWYALNTTGLYGDYTTVIRCSLVAQSDQLQRTLSVRRALSVIAPAPVVGADLGATPILYGPLRAKLLNGYDGLRVCYDLETDVLVACVLSDAPPPGVDSELDVTAQAQAVLFQVVSEDGASVLVSKAALVGVMHTNQVASLLTSADFAALQQYVWYTMRFAVTFTSGIVRVFGYPTLYGTGVSPGSGGQVSIPGYQPAGYQPVGFDPAGYQPGVGAGNQGGNQGGVSMGIPGYQPVGYQPAGYQAM